MIKNYSNRVMTSNAVRFVLKASKKRRLIAAQKAKEIQLEFGLAPNLVALK